jgi:glycosyltransferase 2 family protein
VSARAREQRGFLPKLVVSLLLGALLAWVSERGGVPIVPHGRSFARVDWLGVAFGCALLFALTVLRATRWRFLIAPVKHVPLGEVIRLNWVGFFAIFVLPLRLGEFARPALSKLRARVPISAGLGTVAVERVVDGTLTSLCVAWALSRIPRLASDDPVAKAVPYYASVVLLVFAGALVALVAFLWKRRFAVRLTERVLGIVSPSLARLVAQKVDSVADGLRAIGNARLFAGFMLETVAYWSLNAWYMWEIGKAVGLPFELGHAVAVMGVLALGILLPSGPGLFGSFQVAVSAALRLYFPESSVVEAGSVFVFLLYVSNALMMIAIGVIPLARMHLSLGDILAVKPNDDTIPPPPPIDGRSVGR